MFKNLVHRYVLLATYRHQEDVIQLNNIILRIGSSQLFNTLELSWVNTGIEPVYVTPDSRQLAEIASKSS